MNTKAIQKYEASLQQTVEMFGLLLGKDTKDVELAKLHKMIELDFDPRLGHLTVYEGKLWLCHVGAMWWKNKQDPDRRFGIIHRIVKEDERKYYGLNEEGDLGVIAQLLDYRNGGVVIAEGFGKANPIKPYREGFVTKEGKVLKGNPVEKHSPFIMAQKRAEAQLIKRGFPLGIEVGTMADEDRQEINGESRVVEENEDNKVNPLHPWLEHCPEHGDGWSKGSYGVFHNLADGTKCNLKKVLQPKLQELWSLVGEGACNDWLKEKYEGKTWSQLPDETAIGVIEFLQAKADAREVALPEGEEIT